MSDDEKLWVVTAGDMIGAYPNKDSAALFYLGMVGANLDVEAFRLTPEEWANARDVLAREAPHVSIYDQTAAQEGDASEPAPGPE